MILAARKPILSIALACVVLNSATRQVYSENAPEIPRVDSVVMAAVQPHETDPAIIWYDDFDDDKQQERYAEKSGETTDEARFGGRGKIASHALSERRSGHRRAEGLLRRLADLSGEDGSPRRDIYRCLLAILCQTSARLDGGRPGQVVPRHQSCSAGLAAGNDRPRVEQR